MRDTCRALQGLRVIRAQRPYTVWVVMSSIYSDPTWSLRLDIPRSIVSNHTWCGVNALSVDPGHFWPEGTEAEAAQR